MCVWYVCVCVCERERERCVYVCVLSVHTWDVEALVAESGREVRVFGDGVGVVVEWREVVRDVITARHQHRGQHCK